MDYLGILEMQLRLDTSVGMADTTSIALCLFPWFHLIIC